VKDDERRDVRDKANKYQTDYLSKMRMTEILNRKEKELEKTTEVVKGEDAFDSPPSFHSSF